ncbi:hypothetical protein C2G38_2209683 [Gigaspora rosea]|uniref:CCHC-type domain-containing protein n=1 Tax=Gigaspora rosea TaxID=44941 RepID=A0A397UK31_9GLOM|nr:hypothetical protein C2G38_2209683 [Gigaspora rosea]
MSYACYYITARFNKNYSQNQPTEFTRSNINRLFTPIANLWDKRKENAVQLHRQDVLEKLQSLLTEIQENELANSPVNNDDNEECEDNNLLADMPLQNPKKRKAKGCPKSSKQIKRSEELKPAKRQNQCGNCGEYGHYRPKCSKK